ncbi:hypothetical protein B9Z65_4483 [Elsinoe australis]|uniref:Uncharacterized protein n=1 Tax=Elsinoe australis TaxID=40998 RepID=A0A2P7Z2Y3_9PEZI|nr:hypothetical protein B9Z65_4483 [Elsinoe australis]
MREVEQAALEARHEDEIRAIKQDCEQRIRESRLNAEAEMKKLEVRRQAQHSQPTPEPTKGKLIVPVPPSVKRKAENDAAVFESPVEDSSNPHGRPSTPCQNDKGNDAKKQLVRRVPRGVSPCLRPLYNKATIDFAEVMEARQEKILRLQAKEVQRQVSLQPTVITDDEATEAEEDEEEDDFEDSVDRKIDEVVPANFTKSVSRQTMTTHPKAGPVLETRMTPIASKKAVSPRKRKHVEISRGVLSPSKKANQMLSIRKDSEPAPVSPKATKTDMTNANRRKSRRQRGAAPEVDALTGTNLEYSLSRAAKKTTQLPINQARGKENVSQPERGNAGNEKARPVGAKLTMPADKRQKPRR